MWLVNHGGKCCGIKTIYEMGYDPEDTLGAYQGTGKLNNTDVHYGTATSNVSFFTENAPAESRLARLDRFIEFTKRRRPQHLIEITLGAGSQGDQTKNWEEPLLERGFKLVNTFKNSNSGNIVNVYHLVYDEKAKAKKKEEN